MHVWGDASHLFFFFFLYMIWLTERRADKKQDNCSIKQTINRAIVTSNADFLLLFSSLFDTNRFSLSFTIMSTISIELSIFFWLHNNDDGWQFIIFSFWRRCYPAIDYFFRVLSLSFFFSLYYLSSRVIAKSVVVIHLYRKTIAQHASSSSSVFFFFSSVVDDLDVSLSLFLCIC